MEFLVMLTGMLIGAAAASLVLLGWAASQLRWLAAHCSKQIAYWRAEAERAPRNDTRAAPAYHGHVAADRDVLLLECAERTAVAPGGAGGG